MNAVACFHRDVEENGSAFIGLIRNYFRTSTNLFVLRQIDQTVEALADRRAVLEGFTGMGWQLAEVTRACTVVECVFLDADLRLQDAAEVAIANMQREVGNLTDRRACVARDPDLLSHHCDRLHEAFDSTINSVLDAKAAVEALAAAVERHDAAAVRADERNIRTCEEMATKLHGEDGRVIYGTFSGIAAAPEFSVRGVSDAFPEAPPSDK